MKNGIRRLENWVFLSVLEVGRSGISMEFALLKKMMGARSELCCL